MLICQKPGSSDVSDLPHARRSPSRLWKASVAVALVAVAVTGCNKGKPAPALFDSAAFYGEQTAGPVEFAGGPASPAAPMGLTCSDGSGLELRSLQARAVVEGPLAFTELHLTFFNPEPRQREGRFSITLPPGAAVNRFAMFTDKWMEGEVVEKQQARRIYEDYLHRKQDPALLETGAGNTFSARVFPIPASGTKQLILSYTTELVAPDNPYVLPLAGLGKLQRFSATVAVQHEGRGDEPRRPKVVDLVQDGFTPRRDLVVHPTAAGGPSALRNGDLVATRVTLKDSAGQQKFKDVLVLFDTSASEAVGFADRLEKLSDLLAFLGKNGAVKVKVVAFDQVAKQIFDDAPAKWGDKERATLLDRGCLGASDWGAALRSVAPLMAGRKDVRVIVFGNGVATVGDKKVEELRGHAAALSGANVVRLDTMEMAAQRDMDTLRAIATAGLKHDGLHVQLGRGAPDFTALTASTFAKIQVAVKGAQWVWPRELKGLKGGDSALIYAQHEGDEVTVELTGGATEKFVIKPARAARSLLETAWVSARIKRLLHDSAFGDPDMRPMAAKQALKLSIRHRVLCELTALLVLESDQEYARYNLDQTALSEILSVTSELEVAAMGRDKAYALVASAPRNARKVEPSGDGDDDESDGLFAKLKRGLGIGKDSPMARGADESVATETYEVAVEEQHVDEREEEGAKDEEGAKNEPRPGEGGELKAMAPPSSMGNSESLADVDNDPAAGDSPEASAPNDGNRTDERPRKASKRRAPRLMAKRSANRPALLGGVAAGSGAAAGAGKLAEARKPSAARARMKTKLAVGGIIDAGKKSDRRVSLSLSEQPLQGSARRRSEVERILSRNRSRLQRCHELGIRRGDVRSKVTRVTVRFTVSERGIVSQARVSGTEGEFASCLIQAFRRLRGFPALDGASEYRKLLVFRSQEGLPGMPIGAIVLRRSAAEMAAEIAAKKERSRLVRERRRLAKQRASLAKEQAKLREEAAKLAAEREAKARLESGKRELDDLRAGIGNRPNIKGAYAKVRHAILTKKLKTALREANEWRAKDPGNVMAVVALGDAYVAMEEPQQAARAYGSLIDLFPQRADLRRFAGNLLESTGDEGLNIAIDTYLTAVEQRPDHPAGYHMTAMALAQVGKIGDAIEVVTKGLAAKRRPGNFRGVDRILRDDLAMLQQAANGDGAISPNLRFILTWETDANDVDFHIFDSAFEHASFRHKTLQTGGELYADITTGYGPECFRIDKPTAYPYKLLAHYYAMGPMGFGMGRLQIIRYNGRKGFGVESRPFVIMQDSAYVDMGEVSATTAPIL